MAESVFENTERFAEEAETDAVIEQQLVAEENVEKNDEERFPAAKVVNGIPNLAEGDVFASRFTIDSRCGWDDRVGGTFFATAAPHDDVVLRIDQMAKTDSVLRVEAAFLKKVEEKNSTAHQLFSQIHSHGAEEPYNWLALYFRSGPSLRQVVQYVGSFTFGSAGRFGENLFEILEVIHEEGYLLTSLNTDMFHFCAAARKLFLSDLSTLRADPVKKGLSDVAVPWIGGPQYAPMAHHRQQSITETDDVQAAFFLFVELSRGSLPWTELPEDQVAEAKLKSLETGTLFDGLPEQYTQMWEQLSACAKVDYENMKRLAKEVYQDVGGVLSHDENFDFEREPTEDELPRFIAERVDTSDAPSASNNEDTDTEEIVQSTIKALQLEDE